MLVLIGACLFQCAMIGVLINCTGVLFAQIRHEFGFTMSKVSVYNTLKSVTSALAAASVTAFFFKSNKAYAQNVLKDVLKELTDRQRVIIDNVLKDANVTIAQLAANLDVDERTVRRDITTLQKAGILHREGGRKDGRWVISITKS